MTSVKCIYIIYMNNNAIETSTNEEQAYAVVRAQARIHSESEFKIEKIEKVFDSDAVPRDKLSLHMIRNPRKSNAVHASIHQEDWKIGWEDA